MRHFIAIASVAAACLIGGCKSDGSASAESQPTSSGQQTVSKDMCAHCAGVQTATKEGKCPSCGMMLGATR